MHRLVVAVVCAACGRVGFDPSQLASDAIAARRPCGAQATAPTMLTFSGDIFYFTSFVGPRASIANATVSAIASDGSTIQQAVSDASGQYSLSVPTGGQARNVRLRAELAGEWTTTTVLDAPVDRDISIFTSPQWSFGEIEMWTPSAMSAVYSTVGATTTAATGTINVLALDCSGDPLPGVTIGIEPAPAARAYITPTGGSDQAGNVTLAPFTLGYNLAPGLTHITATAPGLEFDPVDVEIEAGERITLVELQPLL